MTRWGHGSENSGPDVGSGSGLMQESRMLKMARSKMKDPIQNLNLLHPPTLGTSESDDESLLATVLEWHPVSKGLL